LSEAEQLAQLIADAQQAIDRAREIIASAYRAEGVTLRLRDSTEASVARSGQLRAESAVVREQVESAVRALAEHDRRSGSEPQRMIVGLKAILGSQRGPRLDAHLARSLEADVITWAIDAYYDA
jgi:hypothetical protein